MPRGGCSWTASWSTRQPPRARRCGTRRPSRRCCARATAWPASGPGTHRDGSGRSGRPSTVGADGVRSTVAAQTGAPVVWQARSAGAVLYRYYADLPTVGYEWAYGAGVAAGLIPTNDGLTCVFVGTSPQRMRELRRQGVAEAFATLLGESFPALPARVAAAVPAGRLQGWPAVRGYLRRCWGPGWALVGDAGYYKDPITTHGITDGLRDAELLADALVDSLGGGVPEPMALGGLPVRARPDVGPALLGDRGCRGVRLGHRPGAPAAAAGQRGDGRRAGPAPGFRPAPGPVRRGWSLSGGLACDPVVQGQEREAEDPERVLRAQRAVLDEDVELLLEAVHGQGGELVCRRVDVGEVVPGLAVVDAAGQRQAPVGP